MHPVDCLSVKYQVHGMQGLYAIVDPEHCRKRDPREVCEAILSGGCAALQLRAKALPDAAMLKLASTLAAQCRRAGVPFWVNDRPDLALLVGADGLHLGQDDLPVAAARELWGARPLGRSTHSLLQAREASAAGHEVLGIGPAFPTTSKHNPDPVVSSSVLAQVCALDVHVVAIGGVTLERVPALRARGVRLAACIGSVCGAEDPESAARAMHTALTG